MRYYYLRLPPLRPFYRINDVAVVPEESVLAIIEVKTSIKKAIFHEAIRYFSDFKEFHTIKTHLFMFNSVDINKIAKYLRDYKHPGEYQEFDHDTFQWLPDEITGINPSFHLTKDYVIMDSDQIGYTSYFFDGLDGTEISALENFFLSVYRTVELYIETILGCQNDPNRNGVVGSGRKLAKRTDYHSRETRSIATIPLFQM